MKYAILFLIFSAASISWSYSTWYNQSATGLSKGCQIKIKKCISGNMFVLKQVAAHEFRFPSQQHPAQHLSMMIENRIEFIPHPVDQDVFLAQFAMNYGVYTFQITNNSPLNTGDNCDVDRMRFSDLRYKPYR